MKRTCQLVIFSGTLILSLMSSVDIKAQVSNTGIKFIENKGQWDESIKFSADFSGGKILLLEKGISYVLTDLYRHAHEKRDNARQLREFEATSLTVEFLNSRTSIDITPENAATEVYNFYLDKDVSRWASGCRAYNSVTYHNIYPGTDLKFYTENHSLKYDLILKKDADPSQIKFKYNGHDRINLEDGCVFASTKLGTVTENRPVAYQRNDIGQMTNVPCKFSLQEQVLGFAFPEGYRQNRELIIDPELIFSTFSGANSDNFGYTACFDDQGSLYSGGIIFGPKLSALEVNGSFQGGTDMAILKYDSSGSNLLYATFIGGNSGDSPHSMVVNNNNELIIMGTTGSDNYPVSSNAFDTTFNGGHSFSIFDSYVNGTDIVLTKLGSSGNLLSSTYVGSPGNDGVLKMNAVGDYLNGLIQNYGDYQRGDVIMDNDDNVYIASSTDSTGFPATSSIQNTFGGGDSDAVVLSLNSDFSQLRWSTYLGGTNADAAYSVKLDDQNRILVGGGTMSSEFPTTSGALNTAFGGEIDGFITTIDQVGDSIVNSTFLGTDDYDQVYFIDIDADQNVYAAGQTRGDYPISSDDIFSVPNGSQFIHKLTPDLKTTLFSTVFGSGRSEPDISPTAFLANECENLFLSGWGGIVNTQNSPNDGNTSGMPITDDALFPTTDGSDFYLMVLSADGKELLYSTYFGAYNTLDGDHVDGGTSRFDKSGIIYQSVCSCGGSADNFPTTTGAWSEINRGVNSSGIERCNNAAFKFDMASLRSRFIMDEPAGCIPHTVFFTNTSIGGENFYWQFGDGAGASDEESVMYTYEEPGTYKVTLRVTDENTCISEDISTQTVHVYAPEIAVSEPVEICEGESTQLQASGGASYEWSPALGLNDATSANPIASPGKTTTYRVKITTEHGCEAEETVKVTVTPTVTEDFEIKRINDCTGDTRFSFINHTEAEAGFIWDFGDNTTSSKENPVHIYQKEGRYTINIHPDSEIRCLEEKEVSIEYQKLFVPNVFTPNNDHKNDYFEIRSDLTLKLRIFDRLGTEIFRSDDYQNDWDGDGLQPGVYFYHLTLPDGKTCNSWVELLK